MKKLPLYGKILIGMALGIIWGLSAEPLGLAEFTMAWIKPWGTIFINGLKLIAIPLIIFSLIDGISNLSDVSKLSRIGGRTIGLYLATTVIAVTIGLLLVNVIKPGKFLSPEKREELGKAFASDMDSRISSAHNLKDDGPLQILVDIVPDNIFGAVSSNTNMLQVIFFAMLFGVAMILAKPDKIRPVKSFFDGTNEVILKIVDLIMRFAPIGVFALLASLNIDIPLMKALGVYSLNVVLGLALMVFLTYPLILKAFTKMPYLRFVKGILPAQVLAFSTSSSAATLPVTIDCAEKNLGISEEVSSFVLPLGATINMDGTSIHQGVSAVFIAQAFGLDLTLGQQLTILMTAVLSSVGAAAVPGAGIIMLIIVLEAVGLDPSGLALILAVDRPLDMLRTVVNVTGDSTVATVIAGTEGELMEPKAESQPVK
ncbi:MAG: dicarboxylate/amino acid:cation symporter [Cyclobacteriaceae bacterium]|nr:dicarboxylate/amino acid:cation symporter [Cyclobacteriaceae bacterium]UYN86550.1 MAG: dicarboxylate/amino acid:cation symporter [Cyclobacteriaceae bacterium]